jgi:hypothetical protein
MRTSILLLALLLSASPFLAQGSQGIRPAGQHQADKAETQFDKSVPPPARPRQNADPAKLREDANELANLAQSIPPAVEQTTKGMLPKDLDQKLKRIEKLAKQLRSQIDH